MAYSFVQQYSNNNSTGATVAVASVVLTAGQNVVVVANWHAGSGPALTASVSDGTNTYTQQGSTVTTSGLDAYALFYAKNVASGTVTLTLTLSGSSTQFKLIGASVFTGLDTTANAQVVTGQDQATPTTATDAVTSGLMTPTAQPAMVFGVAFDFQHGTGHLTAGTGFTSRGLLPPGTLNDILSEDRRITTLTNVAATFTTDINDDRITIAGIFSEAGAGAGDVLWAQSCL